jgi:hypothetical protein
MPTYESFEKAANTNAFLDGRDTESVIVRNGRWVPIRDLHLIRDLTGAEYELVKKRGCVPLTPTRCGPLRSCSIEASAASVISRLCLMLRFVTV